MRLQNAYDHRLRLRVHGGDVDAAQLLGVPRTTISSWKHRPAKRVIASADPARDEIEFLRTELASARKKLAVLRAWLRIAIVMFRILGVSFKQQRLPEGDAKIRLIRTINRSKKTIPLTAILKTIGLSPARFHAWQNKQVCENVGGLTDRSSCPRTNPTRLTSPEVSIIRDMVTSQDYRHVTTKGLSQLAMRLNKVYASAGVWYRLIKIHQWRRPRTRIYPAKPKIGIRATKPNDIWHVDMTIIRLLDGTKLYLSGVIDNYSRRIVAWKLEKTFDASVTAELLTNAATNLKELTTSVTATDTSTIIPRVMMDNGIENFNKTMDALETEGSIKRVLAQVDVRFSNSMIEAWWRQLKYNWLYLNSLDTFATVEQLIRFYVYEHNSTLPHSAFKGQTPDDMYFQQGTDVPEKIQAARMIARQRRRESNLAVTCPKCQPTAPQSISLQSTITPKRELDSS
jgi:putative transposase